MRTLVPDDHPVLKQTAAYIPVSDISGTYVQTLIADLKSIIASEPLGVAIAAPQVGEAVRLFVVSGTIMANPANPDAEQHQTVPDLVCINPEVTRTSRKKTAVHEGCLSIRGWWGRVNRAERITVRAYDEHGTPFSRGASGLLAQIFQHELDHLEGILYTDKAYDLYEEDPGEASGTIAV